MSEDLNRAMLQRPLRFNFGFWINKRTIHTSQLLFIQKSYNPNSDIYRKRIIFFISSNSPALIL